MQEISEECWSHYDANSPRLPSSHNYREYTVIIHFSLWLLSQLISNRESTVMKFQRWNYNKDLRNKIMFMIFYPPWNHRDDSRLVPCQWEMLLQSNAASHWLGANLESALNQLFERKSESVLHIIVQGVVLYSMVDGMAYDYISKVAEKRTKSNMFYDLNVK